MLLAGFGASRDARNGSVAAARSVACRSRAVKMQSFPTGYEPGAGPVSSDSERPLCLALTGLIVNGPFHCRHANLGEAVRAISGRADVNRPSSTWRPGKDAPGVGWTRFHVPRPHCAVPKVNPAPSSLEPSFNLKSGGLHKVDRKSDGQAA
jgi:hypothetical protein